jgi:hypothetical protein
MSTKIIAIIGFDDGKVYRDVEDIKLQAQRLESATRVVHVLISQAYGQIIGQSKGDLICELPLDNAECLREICEEIRRVPLRCCIGVADDSRKASLALIKARTDSTGIRVYNIDMEPREFQKSEDLFKADKLDFKPLDSMDKEKLQGVVQTLQQNKGLFDQMREQAPDLYSAVTNVAMSLAEIVAADKEAHEAHKEDTVNTINKHLEKNNEQYKQEREKMIGEIMQRLLAEHGGNDQEDGYYGDPAPSDSGNDTDESGFDYEAPTVTKNENVVLSKAEISPEAREKVIQSLKLISDNKEILKQLHESNPEAVEALAQMVGSLGKIFDEQTGENVNSHLDEADIKQHLKEQQGTDEEKAPHINKPEEVHGQKLVFAPGAVRQYNAKDTRKKNANGEWENVSGEAKEGSV